MTYQLVKDVCHQQWETESVQKKDKHLGIKRCGKSFSAWGKKSEYSACLGQTATSLSESFLKFPNCGLPWVAKSCHPVYHPSGLPQVFVRPRFIGTMGVTHSQHALIKPHVLEKTWIRCQALEISQDGTVSISKPHVLIQLVSYI